jgi:hypothetical protein
MRLMGAGCVEISISRVEILVRQGKAARPGHVGATRSSPRCAQLAMAPSSGRLTARRTCRAGFRTLATKPRRRHVVGLVLGVPVRQAFA